MFIVGGIVVVVLGVIGVWALFHGARKASEWNEEPHMAHFRKVNGL